MAQAIIANGKQCGIYSSEYEWESSLGSRDACGSVASLCVQWYAHYDVKFSIIFVFYFYFFFQSKIIALHFFFCFLFFFGTPYLEQSKDKVCKNKAKKRQKINVLFFSKNIPKKRCNNFKKKQRHRNKTKRKKKNKKNG